MLKITIKPCAASSRKQNGPKYFDEPIVGLSNMLGKPLALVSMHRFDKSLLKQYTSTLLSIMMVICGRSLHINLY